MVRPGKRHLCWVQHRFDFEVLLPHHPQRPSGGLAAPVGHDAHRGVGESEQDLEFFGRVRAGYEARAVGAPNRFVRIDATLDREAVARQIAAVLETRSW